MRAEPPGFWVLVSFCWILAISWISLASSGFRGNWITGFSPTAPRVRSTRTRVDNDQKRRQFHGRVIEYNQSKCLPWSVFARCPSENIEILRTILVLRCDFSSILQITVDAREGTGFHRYGKKKLVQRERFSLGIRSVRASGQYQH